MSFLEALKSGAASVCSTVGNSVYSGPTHYLATAPLPLDQNTETVAHQCLQSLNDHQKNQVYGKVWELAKMQDSRVSGDEWGRHNALNDSERLTKALHRLGFLQQGLAVRHTVPCLSAAFGEGGIGSQYFSLVEKLGREPATGQFGLVNGMGVPTLEHAGRDANTLSDFLLRGHNVHCVYHATHQNAPSGDLRGFARDILRMKAVDGGSYTRTSYLIAQQWIDFLTTHPEAKFLQMAHSEGAAHVNAALRLVRRSCPHLLPRIRVINFCPAHFINPNKYSNLLQVRNLVKREDATINPWGTGANQINAGHPHIIVAPHRHDHPHNHFSEDYMHIARPFVEEFFRSGDLYPPAGSPAAAIVQRTPSPTDLLDDARHALDHNDPDRASACVRQLPSGITNRIFFLVWEALGRPMDMGDHFGEDAFFGQNQRSCDPQLKKTILQQVSGEHWALVS